MFSEQYFAAGTVHGDSVTLRLRPVEDADINIVGRRVDLFQITGTLWFNALTNAAGDIVLTRQPPPD